ncbi:hypothetical protein C8R45DRAFT_947048 [Mycena sanguinolenta]|nr:hypothetical protein C8R45DRAFT_947048 [Mycena sanguinolenta]
MPPWSEIGRFPIRLLFGLDPIFSPPLLPPPTIDDAELVRSVSSAMLREFQVARLIKRKIGNKLVGSLPVTEVRRLITISSFDPQILLAAGVTSFESGNLPVLAPTQTPQGLNTNTATYGSWDSEAFMVPFAGMSDITDMPAFASETSFDFTDVNFQLPRASISSELPILPSLPASSPPIASELPPPAPKRLRRPEVDAANIITSSRVRVPSKRVLDGDHTEQRPQKKKKSQSTLFRFDACLR